TGQIGGLDAVDKKRVSATIFAGEHRREIEQRFHGELDDLGQAAIVIDDATVDPDRLLAHATLPIDRSGEPRRPGIVVHDAGVLALGRRDERLPRFLDGLTRRDPELLHHVAHQAIRTRRLKRTTVVPICTGSTSITLPSRPAIDTSSLSCGANTPSVVGETTT